MKEKDLCKRIFRTIQVMKGYNQFPRDFIIFHVPNESIVPRQYVWQTRHHLRDMGVMPGVADWIILTTGKWGAIEVKRNKKGVLSDGQKIFRDAVLALGGEYLCTYDHDECIQWVKDFLK